MKMKYICATIIAYFLTDSLKYKCSEEEILNSLYEKLKNKISLKQM